jgi:hypothetical protein
MPQRSILNKGLILISLGLSLAIPFMAAAIFPTPANGQDQATPLKATLTVQFIATQVCAQGDASCSACVNQNGYYVEAQGLADSSVGPLFAVVFKCYNPYAPPFGTYEGTLTTTAPNGKDSLTWAYSGKNDNAGDFYGFGPFSGTLTITAGTGKFAGARGSVGFTAASGPTFLAGPSPVQFAGTAFYYLEGRLDLSGN